MHGPKSVIFFNYPIIIVKLNKLIIFKYITIVDNIEANLLKLFYKISKIVFKIDMLISLISTGEERHRQINNNNS